MPKYLPIGIIGLFWIIYFIRFGYDFGASDQDEMLPYLYRLLDPTLYSTDWFVRNMTDHLNVRTYFIYALYLPALVLPVWLVAALGYAACWIVIVQSVYQISLRILRDAFGAVLATLLVIVFFHKVTLGANDLVYHLLVPELVAWAFVLPALLMYWNRKMQTTALLLGIGTCFHLITGLTTGLVLVLLVLWQIRENAFSRRSGLQFIGIYGLAALPIVGPIAFQQLTTLPTTTLTALLETGTPYEILVYFRLPLHHLSGYAPSRTFGWLFLIILGIGAFYSLRKSGVLRHQTFLIRFALISSILMGLSFLGVEVLHDLTLAKFQFYKLAVWLKLFALALVAGTISNLLKNHLPKIHEAVAHVIFQLPRITMALFFAAIFLLAIGIWSKNERLWEKAGPLSYETSELAKMEKWITQNTPKNALFAIPPSNTTFRSHAQRSIVVNWLSFPFKEAEMVFWRHQLQQVAPLTDTPIPFRNAPATLDIAYHDHHTVAHPPEWRWANLLPSKPDFILRHLKSEKKPYTLPVAHQNREWVLYKWPKW
ncbi:MAG: hypothetical protein JNN12_10580 [Bacteroidetes Order II. Incertae sedis bacterium]|nr:hypothetical protein [Bacteroidetes Order II. bacterium]